jgi:hypothetical protein
MARIVTQRCCIHLVAAGIAVAGGLLVGNASGQPVADEFASLARAYGAGVHAYFAGDHQRAYDDLTQAIEAGTEDPRVWYFRGLAAAKLGRLDEVEADFATAADREATAAADWDVSRSLERVQGHDRLMLERQRIRARVVALQQRTEAAERRYMTNERRQPEVLRRMRPVGPSPDPLGLFSDDSNPAPAVEEIVTPRDEPADGEEKSGGAEEEKGVAGTDDELEMAVEEPAGDEPLAEEPMTEEPPAEEPVPLSEESGVERVDPPQAEAPGAEVFGN